MKEVVNSPTTDEDPGTLFAEDGVVAEKPAKPGAVDQRESKCRIMGYFYSKAIYQLTNIYLFGQRT
jgi:hypothetical protein